MLRLDANEGPPPPADLLAGLLVEAAGAVVLYPEYGELRAAAAEAYGVAPDEVLPCNGGDEGIRLLVQAFCGPDDPLLLTPPTFGMLAAYARLAEAPVLPVPLGADWQVDLGRVLNALPYAAMTALVSPNNPTGLAVPGEVVTGVLEAAGSRPVLLDETYVACCGQDAVPLLAGHPNLLLLRTLSKAHGVPGLRCGFILADRRVIAQLEPLRSPFNVSAVAAVVGAGLLRRDTGVAARLAAAVAARRRLASALAGAGLEVVPSDTHFCLVSLGAGRDAAVAALAARGILVRAVDRLPGFIRLSVTEDRDADALLAALLPWWREQGGVS
jgi:histidinol-phosphate aminotransferase